MFIKELLPAPEGPSIPTSCDGSNFPFSPFKMHLLPCKKQFKLFGVKKENKKVLKLLNSYCKVYVYILKLIVEEQPVAFETIINKIYYILY